MTSGTPPDEGAGKQPEPQWKRRQRLARVFGDVLPDRTRDELDEPDRGDVRSSTDAWLTSQVPPHHGQ